MLPIRGIVENTVILSGKLSVSSGADTTVSPTAGTTIVFCNNDATNTLLLQVIESGSSFTWDADKTLYRLGPGTGQTLYLNCAAFDFKLRSTAGTVAAGYIVLGESVG